MIRHEQGNGLQPLLQPARLGDLRLPNRVVMAPLTRARVTGGDLAPTDLHAAYYAQRATAGLIITEGTWVSEQAIGFPGVPGISSEPQVTAWRRVTSVVHALGGRIVLQLWHTGAHSHPDHRRGERPAGPSAINPGETSPTRTGRRPTITPLRDDAHGHRDRNFRLRSGCEASPPGRVRRRGDRRQRHLPHLPVP
jgi:N-ethylmaleimide reductase